jgi:glycerate kinase
MARGVRAAGAVPIELPVADGGDGTLDVLLATSPSARSETLAVTGPLAGQVWARLGWMDGSRTHAVIELAEASGLRLLPSGNLDALRASTRGTGELIAAALRRGARQVTVGTGGSASTDGGAGALGALGLRLLDGRGRALGEGGGALLELDRADASSLDRTVRQARIELAVDVDAPLLDDRGAAAVFAPQKGATHDQVAVLEAGLARLAGVLERDLGLDGRLRQQPGAGAAGGFAYGMTALGARIVPGARLVCDLVGVDGALAGALLVLTGEGRLDASTAAGKAPFEVARRARLGGVPCIALVGAVAGPVSDCFTQAQVIGPSLDVEESMRRTAELLEVAAEQAVRDVLETLPEGDQ